MTEINPQQLLHQIRMLNAEINGTAAVNAGEATKPEFADMLRKSINSVNDAQSASQQMKQAFELGTTDVTLAEVMIAAQKADLSFRAMTEVRNKLVNAYQEIMNMPV